MQKVRLNRLGFVAQLQEVASPLCRLDFAVFALILGFGALQFFCVALASDFLSDDVFFADAARSLIQHGFYGINGYAETNMPPGLSSLLALLGLAGGYSHTVFLRAIVVFGTLGFLASYELLRRRVPRVVAAAICLLLISSQTYFELTTDQVGALCPYFFTTMCVLLVARKFEKAVRSGSRIGWGALLTVLVAASLMFASAAIAFLGAIAASTLIIFLRDHRLALARLKLYLPVFLIGIAVQGLWMRHHVEASAGIGAAEWPVSGFPQSYLSQVKVKNGNYPELGLATPGDIPVRILKNAYRHSNLLSRMLLDRWIHIAWMSIVTVGALFLIALGWCYSIWRTGGGLMDWYFAGYEFIYLLWPWELEERFFLPIAPLACLYLWRGGRAFVFLAKNRPRMLGLAWLPMAVFLAGNAWLWMHGDGIRTKLPHGGLQDQVSFALWLLSAILAGWLAWVNTSWLTSVSRLWPWGAKLLGARPTSPLRVSKLSGTVVVAILIFNGLTMQLQVARANLDINSVVNHLPPDALAGAWIRSHTDTNAIVMARHVPIACHYSSRKVVWFPPSSNPQLLMEGILKHKINFVSVVRRDYNYYLPSDDDCFAPLFAAYPGAFRLVWQTPEYRIFEVVPNSTLPSS